MRAVKDAEWLEALFEQYYDLLHDVGKRMCKGQPALLDSLYDHLQEVFLALWRKRDRLADHPNIGGWLVSALRMQIQSCMRKEIRIAKSSAYSLDHPDAPAEAAREDQPGAIDHLLYQEKVEALEALLGKENTQLFLAYTLEGRSAKELAAQYGMTEASVWMRMSRLKRKIVEHPEVFMLLLLLALGYRS